MNIESSQLTALDLEVYKHLREYENDFNSLQGGVHKLASVWLLAALGAIAYSYRLPEGSAYPVSGASLGSIVALLGSVGIFLLWILDQHVYQNLLRAAFLEGLRRESKNPQLPQVRRLMWHISSSKGMGIRLQWFYSIPIIVLAILSGAMCILPFPNRTLWEALVGLFFSAISIVLSAVIMRQSTGKYSDWVKGFADKTIDKWFEAGEGVIEQSNQLPPESTT